MSEGTDQSQEPKATTPVPATAVSGGPINLEQIRKMRESNTASKPAGASAEAPAVSPMAAAMEGVQPLGRGKASKPPARKPRDNEEDDGPRKAFSKQREFVAPKVEVPNIRQGLADDLKNEWDAAVADLDFDRLLVGDASLQVGRQLEDGQRYPGKILKIHQENVFVSLGGPDEGIIPLLQFNETPKVGDAVDCLVRSFNREDGLYELALPGETTSVSDWSDLEEGVVVEARIESANTGGLECKVGNVRGFIPMSQIAEYRVETPADFVGQRLLCVVTEANMRRGNLVLSHRAVLEREKAEKKKERFAKLEVGQVTEGTVRKVMDFGAFVDIGGLDGLIHVSQLSWDRIQHPSEVVKEGDKVQVKIEKIDPETGKIGLSYRALQDHPWHDIDVRFPIGSVVRGTVSRLANFGAFVKLATGIEGLVHLSELANRRVATAASVVKEGQEVEVKVLSADKESQRISLSLKQANAPAPAAEPEVEEEVVPVAPTKIKNKHTGPLKGGTTRPSSGEQFGLKW